MNDWSGRSPDEALFAATRLTPDQVYIQRHDLDGVALSIFRGAWQTPTLVARHDFRSRVIRHIEWSPDSKFLLFTTTSPGGHQPWHATAFVFCRSDNSFREVEPATGTVVSPDFRFESPDVAVIVVQKGEESEAEVKVPLAKAVHDMPVVKSTSTKEQAPTPKPKAAAQSNSEEQRLKALLNRAQELRNQRNLVEQNIFLSPDKRRVEELKLLSEEKDVLGRAIALKKKMEAGGR